MQSELVRLLISSYKVAVGRRRGALSVLTLGAILGLVPVSLAEPPTGVASAPPAGAADNPAIAAGLRRDAQQQADRHSADAGAARAASRQAFRGLGSAGAWALATRSFPGATTGPLFDGAHPGNGARVERYLSPRTAITEDDAGKNLVVASTLPMTTQQGGDQVPVSLDLLDQAGDFAPANALESYVIGDHLGDGIDFPDAGVSVRLDAASDSTGSVQDDRVFYPNVATDADYVVTPEPLGVETFLQLRSPASPERYRLDLGVPAGATLRRAVSAHPIPGDEPQTVEVVANGQVVARVYPPVAADATGYPVPTHIDIDGTDLVWSIDHQDADLQYPILADPEVILPNGGSFGFANWRWGEVHYGNYSLFGSANNDPAYYPGLYQSMPTHSFYTPGDYAEWFWQAPPQTYIYRAKFGNLQHSPFVYQANTFSTAFNGILDTASQWVGGMGYFDSLSGGTSPSNPFGPTGSAFSSRTLDFCYAPCTAYQGGAPEQGYSIFGLGVQNPVGTGGVYTDVYKGWVGMGWAWVYLGDRRPPSITSSRPADINGWVDDGHQSYPFFPTAHDDGLGMYSITLSGAETGNGTQYAPANPCSGDIYRSPCPANWPTGGTNFTYTLAEGTSVLTVQAKDVGDNPASQTWTTHIDRSPPSLALGGSLAAARGSSAPAGSYTLSAAVGDPYSGIGSVSLTVDGVARAFSQPCTGNAGSQSCSLTFDTNVEGTGSHTFQVATTDALGHRSSDSFSVNFNLPADYDSCYYDNKGDASYCAQHDRELGGTDVTEDADPADGGEVDYSGCTADNGTASVYCTGTPPTAGASASGVTYGIADDEYGVNGIYFMRDTGASSFKNLGVSAVRRIVPYNLTDADPNDPFYQHFRSFYRDAVDKKQEIMISFQYRNARTQAETAADHNYLPPKSVYTAKVRAFKSHFPRVAYFSAWNEPNGSTQPLRIRNTKNGPIWLAAYSAILQRNVCRPSDTVHKCGVVAADLVQGGSWTSYLQAYRDSLLARDQGGGLTPPKAWGFHPYHDVDLDRDHDSMALFKNALPSGSQMWLTEIGSRVDSNCTSDGAKVQCNTEAAQAQDITTLLDTSVPAVGIARVYYYQWREPNASKAVNTWDSGLVSSGSGAKRSVYDVLKAHL